MSERSVFPREAVWNYSLSLVTPQWEKSQANKVCLRKQLWLFLSTNHPFQ